MSAINNIMQVSENAPVVRSKNSQPIASSSIQTPMRNRRKLGDSSNVLNTPLSNKTLLGKLGSKTPGFFAEKPTVKQGRSLSSPQAPSFDSCVEETFLETHLKRDNHHLDFLQSRISIDGGRPEPIMEELNEEKPPNEDLLNVSMEPNVNVSFLADSFSIDDVFDSVMCEQPADFDEDLLEPEIETFGKADNPHEAFVNSWFDVDFGKGELDLQPLPPSPVGTQAYVSFLDDPSLISEGSFETAENEKDDVFFENSHDELRWNAMSDLEKRLLSVDIDELLNL